MSDKKLKVTVLSIKNKFDNFLKINLYKVAVEKHDGGTNLCERLVMERGHAVGILAYDPKADKVILINEFRSGILAAGDYPFTESLPAGGLAEGEKEIACAVRETEEETGLELTNPKIIRKGDYVSPGGTSEKISIVFGLVAANKAGGIHGNLNENEDIKTVVLSSSEFIKRVKSGKINDMKTVLAGYWLADNLDKIKKEYKSALKLKPKNI